MKTRTVCLFLITALLLASCNVLSNSGIRIITPSSVSMSENRQVSGFTRIEFSTMGKINMIQSDQETLNISGPDNVVPEIITTVNNGLLTIRTKDNLTISPLGSDNPLTFTIGFKSLTSLKVSGVGDVQIETFNTPSMELDMSGAGHITQNQLTTDDLTINLSGVGGIDITGQAAKATIELSGAGSVNGPDLKIKAAVVNLSGLGGATLWVTDQLNGDISGAGGVSYYGNPQTSTTSTGIGNFKSLGNK